jgi:hypothetical protein
MDTLMRAIPPAPETEEMKSTKTCVTTRVSTTLLRVADTVINFVTVPAGDALGESPTASMVAAVDDTILNRLAIVFETGAETVADVAGFDRALRKLEDDDDERASTTVI